MLICKNFNNISEQQQLLVNKGYGEVSVSALKFDRYYTDEEKNNNRKQADSMTSSEWSSHCDKVAREFGDKFEKIEQIFENSKYNIHQITKETSTIEHYRSNWDFYFYSNRGWNNADYMDFFTLTFNKNRTIEENMSLLEEVLELIKTIEVNNIDCTVLYTFIPNKEKIEKECDILCERLQGKFINHLGMTGKIKVVSENANNKVYGFFKKGSKKKYYHISANELILANC